MALCDRLEKLESLLLNYTDTYPDPDGQDHDRLLYFDDRQLRKLVESPSRASSVFLLNLGKALAAKVEILAALLRTVEEVPSGGAASV